MASYGGFNFNSLCGGYEPFVGIEDEQVLVGGRFKTAKKVIIQGRIYNDGFERNCINSQQITQKLNSLILGLQDDFQSLSAGGFSLPAARCESIEINQSSVFEGADFTVEFLGYPDNLSAFGYKVLDPVDSKQIKENNDGSISIIRNISAKGISTSRSLDGIDNARGWIRSLNIETPPQIFFQIGQLANPEASVKPRRIVETINRFEGSVSMEIEFIYRPGAKADALLNYSVDVSYDDKSGIYSATMNGSLIGNLYSSKPSLQAELKKINFFALTSDAFKKITGFNYLNRKPEQFNTTEELENNTINFSYTYVSDPFDLKKSFSGEVSYDYVRDITTVKVTGTVTARGTQKERAEALEKEAKQLRSGGLYSIANKYFNEHAIEKFPRLNRFPVSESITTDEYDEDIIQINVSAEFSNQFEEKSGLIKYESTVSASPSLDVYLPIHFLDQSDGVFNMNFHKRGNISVQCTALASSPDRGGVVKSLGEGDLNEIAGIVGVTGPRIPTEFNTSSPKYSDGGYSYNFSKTENVETAIFE
jgi:hypothetical protein